MIKMAIVKATYTKQREGAKASIRYIQHRPGKDGAKRARTLFGWDGAMGRHEAYRMIDEAEKGSVFFRFVISPDPKGEDSGRDLYLREITEQTMLSLEDRLHKQVQWVAAEHDDHTPHRHVHVVAIVAGRLQAQDLQTLRQSATDAALFQRKCLDLAREQKEQGREEAAWERSI
jgi:hypothetical protein